MQKRTSKKLVTEFYFQTHGFIFYLFSLCVGVTERHIQVTHTQYLSPLDNLWQAVALHIISPSLCRVHTLNVQHQLFSCEWIKILNWPYNTAEREKSSLRKKKKKLDRGSSHRLIYQMVITYTLFSLLKLFRFIFNTRKVVVIFSSFSLLFLYYGGKKPSAANILQYSTSRTA